MGTINIIRRHEQLSTFLCQNIIIFWNNTAGIENIFLKEVNLDKKIFAKEVVGFARTLQR